MACPAGNVSTRTVEVGLSRAKRDEVVWDDPVLRQSQDMSSHLAQLEGREATGHAVSTVAVLDGRHLAPRVRVEQSGTVPARQQTIWMGWNAISAPCC